jgi:hypothetical protein
MSDCLSTVGQSVSTCVAGGATVVATMVHTTDSTVDPVIVSAADNANGKYKCSWSAAAVGDYSITVTLAGAPIVGSPFAAVVVPSYADTKSSASGPGLSKVAIGDASFQIRSRDRFDNALDRDGDNDNFKVLKLSFDKIRYRI